MDSQTVSTPMAAANDDVYATGVSRDRTVVTEISAIVEFAEHRLDSIRASVPTFDQAKLGFASLEKLKSITTELSSILDRGMNSLKDEKTKLLARLNEIQKVESIGSHNESKMSPRPQRRLWGDESDDDEPAARVPPARNENSVTQNERHVNRDESDGFCDPRRRRGGNQKFNDRDNRRVRFNARDGDKPKKEHRVGDRIPKASPYPMMFERRTTLDDIRGFQIRVQDDKSYGQVISFIFGESVTKIGGIITVVPEVHGKRPWTCEPLLYNGKCQCTGPKLPPHAGSPAEVPVSGLVGIIHKFLINHNGNTFNPGEQSAVHVDAVLLRCVVHSIMQLAVIKTKPVNITLDTFSDVAEPRNLNASMENYYRGRGDENPKAIARGLWIAVATHFVSS